eukprot:gene26693-32792_t
MRNAAGERVGAGQERGMRNAAGERVGAGQERDMRNAAGERVGAGQERDMKNEKFAYALARFQHVVRAVARMEPNGRVPQAKPTDCFRLGWGTWTWDTNLGGAQEYQQVLEDCGLMSLRTMTARKALPELGLVVLCPPRPVHYYALF